jgi:hypothetical protein
MHFLLTWRGREPFSDSASPSIGTIGLDLAITLHLFFAGRRLNQRKFLDLLHTPAHLFPERRPTPINLS